MPILDNILDHEVSGLAIMQGRLQGFKEGFNEGQRELLEGILPRLLEKRFGQLPDWVPVPLAELSLSDLKQIALNALDATNLDDLFSGKR